jgi:hypothetical protein
LSELLMLVLRYAQIDFRYAKAFAVDYNVKSGNARYIRSC